MAPHGSDIFPTLQSCTRLGTGQTIYDVKFWPYGTSNDEQIFAVTGGTETLVCRPRLYEDPPFEVLRWFRDEVDPDEPNAALASLNSLVWARDPDTQKPLLCVAGSEHKHIKILDIESGDFVHTLSGHGGAVNDLAVSPLSTNLIASASEDSTIRLWNIEPQSNAAPCVALLAGEGHKAPILAITFHPNGKWLLSGGIDHAVCLWSVPPLDVLKGKSDTANALIVYYPHFFTKELHPNYVDSLAFYGDLIVSKAARDQNADQSANEIILWKITGFDAEDPPADQPPVPTPGTQTRSSFGHDEQYRGFARLLTLDIPHTDRFYHRFGLYHADGKRPILCMGDQQTRYSFWDLQRLEEGIDPLDRPSMRPKKKATRRRKGANVLGELRKSESVTSGTSGQTPDSSSTAVSSTTASEAREFTLSEKFTPLPAHYRVTANTSLVKQGTNYAHFATSQIAWSPDGTWMVSVGDAGMICVFHRDESCVV